jgi:superfamily II DNA or RNA helicase
MAGLYIKELMIRGDVQRCLVVAPGSLVEQWQEELGEKFGLEFKILTRGDIDASRTANPFDRDDLWIARLDHLSRNPELADRAAAVDWDLVICDEAHRMSARLYGREVKKTQRYQLGERLSQSTRHFLLMTATPHSGKEEDFQLFMALIDPDRFVGSGKASGGATDVSDLMRRMLKEELLTFEGKKLFPERRAYTVEYELSPKELELYEQVTAYVTDEMNRADRFADGQGRRRNAVGFALTSLQRRLASSPAAIHRSLDRRLKRLQERLLEANRVQRVDALRREDLSDEDLEDIDDLPDEEREELEDELIDSATAAISVEELALEIATLERLVGLAKKVRSSQTDKKWEELRSLLEDTPEMHDSSGDRRKIIVFTEHRDTLEYLAGRLRQFIGREEAVVTIHGGTRREHRRAAQDKFRQDEDCLFLVATDAAGEGVNLQSAHLLINYDLPWNPNRIEQRFGRVHRIGQLEVCHMWNLVAHETREGLVFLRLLEKIEQQRETLQGRVYDVLGKVFEGEPLRDLLIRAVRYGDDPDVRAQLDEVIDARVGDGLREILDEEAVGYEVLGRAQVEAIRIELERAAARRLSPHYIRAFFEEAFGRLGGQLREREQGRFEIRNVPARARQHASAIGRTIPVRSYARVTFERDLARILGKPPADLLAPGHPLFDTVLNWTNLQLGALLRSGAVLVADGDRSEEPYVLVYLEHAISDGRAARDGGRVVVSRRIQFVALDEAGEPVGLEAAPFLDLRAPEDAELALATELMRAGWLQGDAAENRALDYAITEIVPKHTAAVRAETITRVGKIEQKVRERLTHEIAYWDARALVLREQEEQGKQPRMNAQAARNRADELASRLDERLDQLAREKAISPQRPIVTGAALVLPSGWLLRQLDDPAQITRARETERVERAAVEAVLDAERRLGREPLEMPRNNPGYDIESRHPNGSLLFLEVKGRVDGADTFRVTRNEILYGLNRPDDYVLAVARVGDNGVDVRYLRRPFRGTADVYWGMAGVEFDWDEHWNLGEDPA